MFYLYLSTTQDTREPDYFGGNYWSDYAGVDSDGDGLGDTLVPYNSSGNITNGGDYLPLVSIVPPEHDIAVTALSAPDTTEVNSTIYVNATICNFELNTESGIIVDFIVDGVNEDNTTIPELETGNCTNVSFTWTAPGVDGVHNLSIYAEPVVNETTVWNNTMSQNISVIVIADLIVEDITWTPTNISDGDTVTFNATIKNNGTGSTNRTFDNTFYIDSSSIGGVSVNGLSAGSSINITRTWTATPGSHNITVFADSGDDVAESNETNNNRTESFSIGQPDLVVEDITWAPTSISDGDTVTFNATIKNNGTGSTARTFANTFYIDGSSIGVVSVNELSAGCSINITRTWTATPGSHNITVFADSDNDVFESDETNNNRSESLPGIERADLIITDITRSPTNISDGETVTFTATVENTGAGNTSREFYVRFEVDDSYIGRQKVSGGIAAGGSVTVNQSWVAESGSGVVKAIADEYNVVVESNETNNEFSQTLPEVSAPDLVVTGIIWSVDISDGTEVTFNATVKNQGDESTPRDFFVRFEIDDKYIGRQQIINLDAGESAEVSQTWISEVGNHIVKVAADEYGSVDESKENNNKLSKAMPEVLAPDLNITGLACTPQEDITSGDEVTLTAAVVNTGAGNTFRDFFVRFEVNDSYEGRQKVCGLNAGSSIKVNQTWVAVSGNYTAKIIVDEYDVVEESNEDNNEYTQYLPDIPYPDLVITNISWSPAEGINDGDEVTINATVKNNGTDNTSREFFVGFEVNGSSNNNYTFIGRQKVSGVGAGESAEVSQSWIALGGNHTVRAIADEYDAVAESDEDNNNLTRSPLYVITRNLIITDITWSPSEISDGDEVNFTAAVANTGGNTTRGFFVRFMVDDEYIGLESVEGGLSSGESISVTLSLSWDASSGSHTVNATVDDSELSKSFEVVDTNPPTLVSISPANGTIAREVSNVTATLSDTRGSGIDLDSSTIEVKLNGAAVPGTKTVEGDDKIVFTPTNNFTEGDYTVIVTARDNTSNVRTNTTCFTIDKTCPEININGVVEGGHYETSVTPVIAATDPHLKSVSITLNGRPFESGTTIKIDGVYTLIVEVTDEADNTVTKSVNFTVDTAPAAPTGLSITYGDSVVHLNWNANVEPDVAGYNVYRDGTKINDELIEDTDYQDTNVTVGEEYVYEISAVDESGHESERAGVASIDLSLVSYGTSVDSAFYLTRGFVDFVKVDIANKEDSSISIDSVKFDLIDSVGNVCYETTYGSFNIGAGGSKTIEKQLLINKNLTSKLRVTVDIHGDGEVSTTYVVNVQDAPDEPLKTTAPTLTEGYADEITLEFTNYGSAPLSINPDDVGLYLNNSNGNVVAQGAVSGAWKWVESNATVSLRGFISPGSPHPENLFLNLTLPTYYGSTYGQYKGTAFDSSVDACFRYQARSPIEIYHGVLIRGASAQFNLTFVNQGTATLKINKGAVKVYLMDENDTVLVHGTSQREMTVILPDTTSEFSVDVNVPDDAPDFVAVKAEVTATCWDEDIGMLRLNATTWAMVGEPEYNANATADKTVHNRGEKVTVTGMVTSTEDGEPVPNAVIRLEICSKGFNRKFSVKADSDGRYEYVLKPLATEAGKYIVSAAHPSVMTLEQDARFEILGLYTTPWIDLKMSQNSKETVYIEVMNRGESNLTGIKFEVIDKNATDEVTANITDEVFELGPGEKRRFDFDVIAGEDTPDEASFNIKTTSDQTSAEICKLSVELYPATPTASIFPHYIRTGLNPGRTQVDTVLINNIGYGLMENVTIVDASLPWISIVSDANLGDIPAGEDRTFDIFIHPSEDVEPGIYEDEVKIRSANHRTMTFPMRVIITSEETGDLKFVVKDEFGECIPDAKISLVNQEVYTVTFKGKTDSNGELLFTGIPVGKYSYQVIAPYHDPMGGVAVVEVGVEREVEVTLSYSFLKVEWEVTPTEIEDVYEITHNITYDSRAPIPYVKTERWPEVIFMVPGETAYGNITLTNMNDIVSVFNLTPRIGIDSPLVSVEMLVDNIPELKPGESITVPYAVKLSEHHSPGIDYCVEYKVTKCWVADKTCAYGVYLGGVHQYNVYKDVKIECETTIIKPTCADCVKSLAGLTQAGVAITTYDVFNALIDCMRKGTDIDACVSNVAWAAKGYNIVGTLFDVAKDCFACIAGLWCTFGEYLPTIHINPVNPHAPPVKIMDGWGPPPPGSFGGGGPSGGGGGWSLPYIYIPSPFTYGDCKLSPETMCIRVKLEIKQELTMERQAFDAMLKMTNTREDYEMTDIAVDIDIRDSEGNPANDLFFLNVTSMDGIDSIENGRLDPEGSGTIHWLFIPTPGAGGTKPDGLKYTAKARINYTMKSKEFNYTTWPDDFTVEPMPKLILDYMLPQKVYGDDPMTVGVKEPAIPFVWGVRVKNEGYGHARNLAIDSAQPKIVEATMGVHIDFKLLGTWVDGAKTEDTLKINFGDIPPDSCATAGWEMMCSLTGNFSNYTASYRHSDALGGEATSLIEDLRTHILVHEFVNDKPGQDEAFDFLIDTNDDGVPDMIIDSMDNDQSITSVSAEMEDVPTAEEPTVRIAVNKSDRAGWIYAEVDDPLENKNNINRIVRCIDGKELNSHNYWLRDGKVYLVDDAAKKYKITYEVEDTTPPIISNERATDITSSSAIIRWTTNEDSDSLVKYGDEAGNYTKQEYDAANVTSHSINLVGLNANTTYYYVVNSTDESGNANESVEYNFTTLEKEIGAPNITSFAPPSLVNDTVCKWRTFNVSVNQTVNVSWYLNDSFLFKNESVAEANYTLHAEVVREHNVSAIASNPNGTDMHTWWWNVTEVPSPCYIATATYGTPLDENIDVLRKFRNEVLMTNPIGETFVSTYYATSPPIADALRENDGLRSITRLTLITPLVYLAKIVLNGIWFVFIIGLVVVLSLRRDRMKILKSLFTGMGAILVFIAAIFSLGFVGYAIPLCAVVGAYMLPFVILASVSFAILQKRSGRSERVLET